jgi:alpha-methylacyl-CoA racemase
MAGHDINYLAVSGVLSQLGPAGVPPQPPANVLADFAGGGLVCALGIVLALVARAGSGRGQVVEANIVDGAAYLGTFMRLMSKTRMWGVARGMNLLDGGSPFYRVYECKDGGFMAVGALEPRFFKALHERLGVGAEALTARHDPARWPALTKLFRDRFLEKMRREWEAIFDGSDACCTPVLTQVELEDAGYEQRAAVRLSETPAYEINPDQAWASGGLVPGAGGEETLRKWIGWQRGKDYDVDNGGLVVLRKSML